MKKVSKLSKKNRSKMINELIETELNNYDFDDMYECLINILAYGHNGYNNLDDASLIIKHKELMG